jgi:TP901 family phage tail tape measure protein
MADLNLNLRLTGESSGLINASTSAAAGLDQVADSASHAADQVSAFQRQQAAFAREGVRLANSLVTPSQQYDRTIQNLTQHLSAQNISQEQFNLGQRRAEQQLQRTTQATTTWGASLSAANKITLAVSAALGTLSLAKATSEIGAFGSAMNNVRALTAANESEMQQLSKAARELGATTAFNAQQAAEAESVLAGAGLKVNEILGATPSVLNLAAAGTLALSDAAEIATGIMSGMGKSVADLPKINDVLVKTAADTKTTVLELGQAFGNVAPIANAFGMSLEDTSAALGILAQNNIKGAEAGTQLKSLLNALSNETPSLTAMLGKYGLTMADVNVETKGYNTVMENLRKAHLSATDAIQIFGTEAAGAGLILSNSNPEVAALSKALREAEGAAGKMAAILNQGLEKELDALYGTISEGILQLGDAGLTGALSKVITTATGVISVYEGMLPKYAESNKLTAEQTIRLKDLASNLQNVAGAVGGITAVAAAIWGCNAAMVAFNVATKANPWVLGAGAVAAGVGYVYTKINSETEKYNDSLATSATLAEQNLKIHEKIAAIAAMPQASEMRQKYGPVAGDAAEQALKYAKLELQVMVDQREAMQRVADATKNAGAAQISLKPAVSESTKLMQDAVDKKNKALSKEGELQQAINSILEGRYKSQIISSANKYGVDPNFMLAVAQQESNSSGTSKTVSSAGARGLMQIMPSTAAGLARDMSVSTQQIYSDLKTHTDAAALLVKQNMAQLRKEGQLTVANLAGAYNAGFGNLKKYHFNPVEFPDNGKSSSLVKQTIPYMQSIEKMHKGLLALGGVDSFKSLTDDTKQANKEAEEYVKNGLKFAESLKTPVQEYNAALAQLNQSRAEGFITDQQYSLGLDGANDKLMSAVESSKAYKDQLEITKRSQEEWQDLFKKGIAYQAESESSTDKLIAKLKALDEVYSSEANKGGGLLSGDQYNTLAGRAIDEFKAPITEANNKVLSDYDALISQINNRTKDLGATNSAVFDGALGGINTLVGAMSEMTRQIESSTKAQEGLNAQHDRSVSTAMNDMSLDPKQRYTKMLEIEGKYLEANKTLEQERTNITLTGTRQMIGATAKMFSEKSGAAKALHAIEKTIATAQLAMNTAKMVSDIAATGPAVASGVAQMFSQGGFAGFAGAAAFLGIMASLGFSGGGTGGTYGLPQKPAIDTRTQGTVLGDVEKSSESTKNVMGLLSDIHAKEYRELQGINNSMLDLTQSIKQAVSSIFKAGGVQATDIGQFGKQIGSLASVGAGIRAYTTLGASLFLDKLPVLGSVINAIDSFIFGSTKTSLKEIGLATSATKLSDVNQGVNPQQYQVLHVDKKGFLGGVFGGNKSYDKAPEYSALNEETARIMNGIFINAATVMKDASKIFGGEFDSAIAEYVLPALQIDLKDLKGDDAVKKVNDVLSTALDNAADAIFEPLKQYQQVNEGMFETIGRLATQLVVLRDSFTMAGVPMQATGLAAIALSDAMVKAAGDLKTLRSNFEDFFSKFFTDAEKQAYVTNTLTGTLKDSNLILPETREGWKLLVQQQLALGETNAQTSVKLLGLTDAADKYYAGLDAQKKALDELSKSLETVNTYGTSAGQQFTYFATKLDSAFTGLGQKTPTSVKSYQDLVNGMDTSTAAGKALQQQLIALQPEVMKVNDLWKQTQSEINALIDLGFDLPNASRLAKELSTNFGSLGDAMSILNRIMKASFTEEQLAGFGLKNATEWQQQLVNANPALKQLGLSAGMDLQQISAAFGKSNIFEATAPYYAAGGQEKQGDPVFDMVQAATLLSEYRNKPTKETGSNGTGSSLDPQLVEFNTRLYELNAGSSDLAKSLAALQTKYNDYASNPNIGGPRLQEWLDAETRAIFKPIADEFAAIGQTDYQRNLQGITDWANEMLGYAPQIAAAYKITNDQAIAGISAVKQERLKALDAERVKIMASAAQTASRLNNTDFESTLYGISDGFLSQMAELIKSGGKFADVAQLYSYAVQAGATATAKAVKQIQDDFKAVYETISTKRNAIADDLTRMVYQDPKIADEQVALGQFQRAIVQLNSGIFEQQMTAIDTLHSLTMANYSKQSEAIGKLKEASKGVADYIQGFKVGNLSTLSPEAMLAETRAQYQTQLAAARAGDPEAYGKATGAFDKYAQALQDYYGSGTATQTAIAQGLAELGGLAQPSGTNYQQQLVDLATVTKDQLLTLNNSTFDIENQRRAAEAQQIAAINDSAAAIRQGFADSVQALEGFAQLLATQTQNVKLKVALEGTLTDAQMNMITALYTGDPQETFNALVGMTRTGELATDRGLQIFDRFFAVDPATTFSSTLTAYRAGLLSDVAGQTLFDRMFGANPNATFSGTLSAVRSGDLATDAGLLLFNRMFGSNPAATFSSTLTAFKSGLLSSDEGLLLFDRMFALNPNATFSSALSAVRSGDLATDAGLLLFNRMFGSNPAATFSSTLTAFKSGLLSSAEGQLLFDRMFGANPNATFSGTLSAVRSGDLATDAGLLLFNRMFGSNPAATFSSTLTAFKSGLLSSAEGQLLFDRMFGANPNATVSATIAAYRAGELNTVDGLSLFNRMYSTDPATTKTATLNAVSAGLLTTAEGQDIFTAMGVPTAITKTANVNAVLTGNTTAADIAKSALTNTSSNVTVSSTLTLDSVLNNSILSYGKADVAAVYNAIAANTLETKNWVANVRDSVDRVWIQAIAANNYLAQINSQLLLIATSAKDTKTAVDITQSNIAGSNTLLFNIQTALSAILHNIINVDLQTYGMRNLLAAGITVRSEYRGGGLATFAKGGAYPGGMALVGEQGPELINFNSPGWISTAAQTQQIIADLQANARAGFTSNSPVVVAPSFKIDNTAQVEELKKQTKALEEQTDKLERILAVQVAANKRLIDELQQSKQHSEDQARTAKREATA